MSFNNKCGSKDNNSEDSVITDVTTNVYRESFDIFKSAMIGFYRERLESVECDKSCIECLINAYNYWVYSNRNVEDYSVMFGGVKDNKCGEKEVFAYIYDLNKTDDVKQMLEYDFDIRQIYNVYDRGNENMYILCDVFHDGFEFGLFEHRNKILKIFDDIYLLKRFLNERLDKIIHESLKGYVFGFNNNSWFREDPYRVLYRIFINEVVFPRLSEMKEKE